MTLTIWKTMRKWRPTAVCGELTTLHCNRCLFVVCADCACPNGCDEPVDTDLKPMTKLSDIGRKKP